MDKGRWNKSTSHALLSSLSYLNSFLLTTGSAALVLWEDWLTKMDVASCSNPCPVTHSFVIAYECVMCMPISVSRWVYGAAAVCLCMCLCMHVTPLSPPPVWLNFYPQMCLTGFVLGPLSLMASSLGTWFTCSFLQGLPSATFLLPLCLEAGWQLAKPRPGGKVIKLEGKEDLLSQTPLTTDSENSVKVFHTMWIWLMW